MIWITIKCVYKEWPVQGNAYKVSYEKWNVNEAGKFYVPFIHGPVTFSTGLV